MSKKIFASLVAATVISAPLFFCGCAETGAPANELGSVPSVSADTVLIQNFAFTPATLQVSVGAVVTWQQNDSAVHTVTSDEDFFASTELAKGDQFSFTFEQAGEYKYHCGIHPSMKGTILVQ